MCVISGRDAYLILQLTLWSIVIDEDRVIFLVVAIEAVGTVVDHRLHSFHHAFAIIRIGVGRACSRLDVVYLFDVGVTLDTIAVGDSVLFSLVAIEPLLDQHSVFVFRLIVGDFISVDVLDVVVRVVGVVIDDGVAISYGLAFQQHPLWRIVVSDGGCHLALMVIGIYDRLDGTIQSRKFLGIRIALDERRYRLRFAGCQEER